MNTIKIDNNEFKKIREAISYITNSQQKYSQQDLINLLATSISSSIVAMTVIIIINNFLNNLFFNLVLITVFVIGLTIIMHIFVFLCIVPLHKHLEGKKDKKYNRILENMCIFGSFKHKKTNDEVEVEMLKQDIYHTLVYLDGFHEKQRDNLRTATFIAFTSGIIFALMYPNVNNLFESNVGYLKITYEFITYLILTFIIAIIVYLYGKKIHFFIQGIMEKVSYFFLS